MIRRFGGGLFTLLLIVLCIPLPLSAGETALRGGWRLAEPGQVPVAVMDDSRSFSPFDPSRLHRFPRDEEGVWVRLESAGGGWPAAPLTLEIPEPPFMTAALFAPDGNLVGTASLDAADTGHWQGHGRLAFLLTRSPGEGQPLLLRLQPDRSVFGPMRFVVRPLNETLEQDNRWLAVTSACFATMVVMAIVVLLFALRLGDAAFYCYVGYILGYALLQMIQSGFAFQPLGLGAWLHNPLDVARVALGLSTALAVLFLDRFANLRYFAPLAHRVVPSYGVAMLGLTALSAFNLGPVEALMRAIINPLLLAGAVLLLGAAIVALLRGSRYAGFFLVGWTPLLVVTALCSAQVSGGLAGWSGLNDAGIVAGAFEAVVLSLGLLDRTASMRTERDSAQKLADMDSLTGLLNRRAWLARVQPLIEQSFASDRALTLLFLDLDHFKSLNDCFGHAAGDAALVRVAETLRQALRPGDVVSRFGGEEFVAALPACSENGARLIAERIRRGIAELALTINAEGVRLTASIGIASIRRRERMESLLARADKAMYDAKARGRNQIVVAEESTGAGRA